MKHLSLEMLESRLLLSASALSEDTEFLIRRPEASLWAAGEPGPLNAPIADAPELPRVYLDTTYAPATSGTTWNVSAGQNLQNVINSAQRGDTILLEAGATFTGNFTLPSKSGSGWLTIRTATPDAAFPAPGTRITPVNVNLMPRLVSPNSAPALATQNGANHYRVMGIEFTIAAGVPENFGIVSLGSGSQNVSQTPNNLIFDRVYIHGTHEAQIQNGMRLNSASTAVIDSWFDQCQATTFESHNIGGYNGPGPYKLVNNTFSSATIPVIFGGATTSVTGLIPSDMEIRGNHFTRPLSWRPGDPSYAGTAWYVKNLFELKNAQRVLFEGNVLEHNWPHTGTTPDGSPQHGYAVLLTVRSQGSAMPWAVVQDVTLANNIIRKSNVGISISGTEGSGTRRIRIENNLLDDIGLNWGNNDRSGMFAQIQTVGDVIVNHNTIINDGDIIFANGAQAGDLVFTNNIVNHNAARTTNRNYGINAPGTAVGNASLAAKFFEYEVTKNVMSNAAGYTNNYPAGNFFPSNFAAVGFTNLAGRDYRLASGSAYKGAGTDGKDLGADFDLLHVATAGAISGVWPQALQNIAVNGNAAQRSMVATVNLTFNQPITLASGALSLVRRGGSGISLNATPSADLKSYTLTFSGTGVSAGSLSDGIYDFLADVSRLRDAFGVVPIGTRTNQNGALAFHRLFGDSDGDKDVDSIDSLRFRSSQGSLAGQSGYLGYFDIDADGDIDSIDSLHFRSRQGTVFSY